MPSLRNSPFNKSVLSHAEFSIYRITASGQDPENVSVIMLKQIILMDQQGRERVRKS
jgi:hypothetical protein